MLNRRVSFSSTIKFRSSETIRVKPASITEATIEISNRRCYRLEEGDRGKQISNIHIDRESHFELMSALQEVHGLVSIFCHSRG